MLGFRPIRDEMEGIGDLAANALVIVAWVSLFGAVAFVAQSANDKKWEKECVRRGVATYDQQTSNWKWTVGND
jgi:hypothetical protein